MKNFDLGKRLLSQAEEYYEKLDTSIRKGSWNTAVRHAQEVVELALKGLLKLMGVDYPKTHDVGEVFSNVVKQKGVEVDPELLAEIQLVSAWLTESRAPAFYYEKEYTEEDAKRAKEGADKIINFAREFSKVLKRA
jgi:hypothetical protein